MGSNLGDQGYSPIEILRYYYGDDMRYLTPPKPSPASHPPGLAILWKLVLPGNKVLQMQEQLNVIAGAILLFRKLLLTGFTDLHRRISPYIPESIRTARPEQSIILHGIKFPEIYVGVSRIAELYG